MSNIVDSAKLIHRYLPKQVDIDKIMNIIKRKVLKGTHLALTIKEDTSMLLEQFILQRSIQLYGPKQTTK